MSLSDLINAKNPPVGFANAKAAKTAKTGHRHWRITEADGTAWTSSFCPPQDLAEVKARYPGALSCAPCPSPAQPPGAPLSDAEGVRLRAWLGGLEDDPATQEEILDACQKDADARAYWLGRVPGPDPQDDRRTCRQCAHLARSGRCLAAGRGELVATARTYRPPPDRAHRCEGYAPAAADPDRRPGRERWPG